MTGSGGLLRRRRSDDSPPAAASGSERRRNVLQTTVFQVAKLITPGFEELCILRDISPTGLRAETYRAVAADTTVSIEFRTGHTVSGRVIRASDNGLEVDFDAEVSVVRILSHSSFDDRVGRIRPPRLNAELDGQLRAGLQWLPVRTCDLSQAGVKLRIDHALRIEQACDLSLPGLDRRCVMRWQRDGAAGLIFADPLTYPEFAQWRLRLAERGLA